MIVVTFAPLSNQRPGVEHVRSPSAVNRNYLVVTKLARRQLSSRVTQHVTIERARPWPCSARPRATLKWTLALTHNSPTLPHASIARLRQKARNGARDREKAMQRDSIFKSAPPNDARDNAHASRWSGYMFTLRARRCGIPFRRWAASINLTIDAPGKT